MKKFNKRQLMQMLNEDSKVDKHMTAVFMADFSCADKFGGQHHASSPEGFISNLKKLGAVVPEVIYEAPYWIVCEKENEIVSAKEIEPVLVKEDVMVDDVVAEIQEMKVDWEWVDNLANNSPNKKELEKYAAKFNVDLKRNRSLDTMRDDFREALSVNKD